MLIHSPKELALYVSSQRKQRNLSQAAVAEAVGLKQATISAFENKPERTKLETVFQILSAINLDMTILPKDKIPAGKTKWKHEW